jgi:hypothetical protein
MKLKALIALLIDLEVEYGEEEVRVPFYSGGLNTIPVTSVERYDDPDGTAYVLIEAGR